MRKSLLLFEIGVLFILSLTPFLWLKEAQVVLGHDSGFRLSPLLYLQQLFFSWDHFVNFGADRVLSRGFLITQLPEVLFTALTGSMRNGQLLTFVFWFFIMGFSMYLCTKSLFPKKEFWILRLFSSTFYVYNFFLLQGWFIVERAKFSLYAFLPLGFLLLYKTFRKEYSVIKGATFFSLISLFLNGGGQPPLYGGVLVVYVVMIFYLTVANVTQRGLGEIYFSLKIILVFLIGVIAINAYWIFPQAYLVLDRYSAQLSSVGGLSGILAWESAVDKHAGFLNLFRFLGIPDWYDNLNHTYANIWLTQPLLVIASFLPFFIILMGLYKNSQFSKAYRYDRLVYLLLLIFLVGMTFTAGSHPPFGFLYVFFIQHVPGFAIFRSAFYKFAPSVWFSGALLTGYFLNVFVLQKTKKRLAIYGVGVFSILLLLLYHFPFFSGNFFRWNKPFSTKVTLPQYVLQMFDYIKLYTPSNSKILLLPGLDPEFHADSYLWGYWSLDVFPRLGLSRAVVANDSNAPTIVTDLYRAIDESDTKAFLKLISLTGINKILWRNDVLYSDKVTTSSRLTYLQENIRHFPGVREEQRFGEWTLYEITSSDVQPVVYTATSLGDIGSQSFNMLPNEVQSLDRGLALINLNEVTGKVLQRQLSDLTQFQFLEPVCLSCDKVSEQQIEKTVLSSSSRFLPNSPFYFLVLKKEKDTLEQYKNSPGALIDAHLTFSTKRILEIAGFIAKNDTGLSTYIKRIIVKYEQHIQAALQELKKLSEYDAAISGPKIISYLKVHSRYLVWLENKRTWPMNFFDGILEFISQRIALLESQNPAPNNYLKRFAISVHYPGIYSLRIGDRVPSEVRLDKKLIRRDADFSLEAGWHTLETSYPLQENLIDLPGASAEGKIVLRQGERKEFPISHFTSKNSYIVNFEYRVSKGSSPLVMFSQDNDKLEEDGTVMQKFREQLFADGNWHDINFEVEPNLNATTGELIFYLRSDVPEPDYLLRQAGLDFFLWRAVAPETVLEVQKARVEKVLRPNILLKRVASENHLGGAAIDYEQIDPTLYRVSVRNWQPPFVLAIHEGYDSGWHAYVMNGAFRKYWLGAKIDILRSLFSNSKINNNHFKINEFANGWLFQQQGDYTVVVVFWPQVVFYAGLLVSMSSVLSLIICALTGIFLRRR